MSLIGLSVPDIQQTIIRLEEEVKGFKEELFRISWYMRGGVTVNDLLHIFSFEDREAAYAVIKSNLETTKITQMPLL